MKRIYLFIIDLIIGIGPPLAAIIIIVLAINCYIKLYG